MMSDFRELAEKAREKISPISITGIPQIERSEKHFDYAKELIRTDILTSRLSTKITIVDPYFTEQDISIMAEIYGGYSDIELEIITKFDNYGKSEGDKSHRKSKIQKSVKYLVNNGQFKEIKFFQTKEQMHDRYLIAWKDEDVKRVVLIGGSISQKFGSNTCLICIENLRMQKLILIYLKKMKENICDAF